MMPRDVIPHIPDEYSIIRPLKCYSSALYIIGSFGAGQ
jgi:hypothetical protein